jgi:hypothetical protein
MSRATGDRDLEARLEALRRELAALIVTLSNVGRRIEDLADELRSRRQAVMWSRSTGDSAARVVMP